MDKRTVIKTLNVVTVVASIGTAFAGNWVEQERQNDRIDEVVEKKLNEKLEEMESD